MMLQSSSFRVAGGYSSSLGVRKFSFKKAVKEVMRDRAMNQFLVRMENIFRTIVREELERLFQPQLLSSERSRLSSLIEPSGPEMQPRLQLRFINSLPSTIFTGSRLEAEGGSPIAIELVDANTNSRVTTGPLSSSRLEIVALDGDFTDENWDGERFNRNILRQREGRRPLITGDLVVTLNEGIGFINGDTVFTDNSSWIRSRKFRLGAKILQRGSPVSPVKEARSEAFVCKDHRGESYKKHDPPFPGDEIWRLEKIAKDGVFCSRLARNEIRTVKDFRRAYTLNANWLRCILGDGGGVSNRTWESIVAHALRCVLDESECYVYNTPAHRTCLLLNSVYEVVKVSFEDRGFQNVDQLSFAQKVVLDELKREAYGSINSFIPVSGRAFADTPPRPLPCPQDVGCSLVNSGLHHINFQDQPGNLIHFDNTAQTERLMGFDQSSVPTFQLNGHWSQVFSSALRNSFRAREPIPVSSSTFVREDPSDGSQGQIVQSGRFENGEITHPHVSGTDWSPGSSSWAEQAYNALYVPGTDGAELFGVLPDFNVRIIGSPKARWCKIRAALKFREVWRHTSARNRGNVYKHY